MGKRTGIALGAFVVSLLTWLAAKDMSPGMNIGGTFLATTTGVITVLLYLRHLYRSAGADEPLTGYMVIAAIVCLVAISLNITASSTRESEEEVRKAESGSVTTVVSSPRTAPDKSWTVNPSITFTSARQQYTTLVMSITEDSSAYDLDILLVLEDGTESLCESEKRVNWERDDSGTRIEASCDIFVPYPELQKLSRITVTDSHGAGRVGLEEAIY